MNARALTGLLVATLFTAACGEVVQIGAQGDDPVPPVPIPPDACIDLPCGASCPLTECTDTECTSSLGGMCSPEGFCSLNAPVCPPPFPGPDPRCLGLPCGVPCDQCVPSDPACTPDNDAGTGLPPMTCDALQQCQPVPLACP